MPARDGRSDDRDDDLGPPVLAIAPSIRDAPTMSCSGPESRGGRPIDLGPLPVLSPSSSLALLDPDDGPFEAIAADLLSRVDLHDPSARILAELLLIALDRYRRAARLEPRDELPNPAWCRFHALAERNVRSAIRELQRLEDRAARRSKSAASRSKPKATTDPGPVEPPPPPEDPPLPESTPEQIAEASSNWRSHIALVRSVSEEWPILLRLRREVEDVAAWLLDGKTEEELMRWYPGLTPADIAACRSCDAEGLCGPFDPADGPYPPGLPVFDDLPDDPTSG